MQIGRLEAAQLGPRISTLEEEVGKYALLLASVLKDRTNSMAADAIEKDIRRAIGDSKAGHRANMVSSPQAPNHATSTHDNFAVIGDPPVAVFSPPSASRLSSVSNLNDRPVNLGELSDALRNDMSSI